MKQKDRRSQDGLLPVAERSIGPLSKRLSILPPMVSLTRKTAPVEAFWEWPSPVPPGQLFLRLFQPLWIWVGEVRSGNGHDSLTRSGESRALQIAALLLLGEISPRVWTGEY